MERAIWILVLGVAIYFAYWSTQHQMSELLPSKEKQHVVETVKPPEPVADVAMLVPKDYTGEETTRLHLGDSGRGPEYETNLDNALLRAHREHKPLIMVVTPRNCPRTDAFATTCDTYPVRPYYEKCVWLYIDMENEAQMQDLLRRCPPMREPSQFPIVLSFSADGAFLGKCGAPDALALGHYLETVATAK